MEKLKVGHLAIKSFPRIAFTHHFTDHLEMMTHIFSSVQTRSVHPSLLSTSASLTWTSEIPSCMVSPHPVLPWSYPFFLLSGWASKNANLISHSTIGSHSVVSFPFLDWNKNFKPLSISPSIISNYFYLGLWTPELSFLSHVPFPLWLTVSLYIVFYSDPSSSPFAWSVLAHLADPPTPNEKIS